MTKKFISLLIYLFLGCSTLYTEIPPGFKATLWDSQSGEVTILDSGRYSLLFSPTKRLELYDVRWQVYKEDHVEVITQDDLHIDVVASIIIRPFPDKIKELNSEIGKNYYNTIVKSEFRTAIRNVLSSYPYVQIAKKSPDIEKDIIDVVSSKVKTKYIEVYDVNFDDINLSKEIVAKIEEKLKRQQEAEAMKFIKRKVEEEAEIAKIQATKEAEAEFIKAQNEEKISKLKATREAENEIIKAKAKAKSQELLNSTLTPLHLKYKALESHYKAFESPNTKLVIVPIGKNGLPIYINPTDILLKEIELEKNHK